MNFKFLIKNRNFLLLIKDMKKLDPRILIELSWKFLVPILLLRLKSIVKLELEKF